MKSRRLIYILPILAVLISALPSGAAPPDSSTPSERRLALVDSAGYAINSSRWSDAERLLTEALRLDPANRQNALLLSNLGSVQTQLGKYPEALQSYTVGLTITPASTIMLTNRGALLLQTGNVPLAVDDFDAALAVDSTLTRPRLLRALANITLGNLSAAETDLHAYIRRVPDDDYPLMLLAQCREMQNDRPEAEKLLVKALGLQPDADNYFNLIRMLLVDGDIQSARDWTHKALSSFPDEGRLYLLRGYINRKLYRGDEALADREIALAKGASKTDADIWIPLK